MGKPILKESLEPCMSMKIGNFGPKVKKSYFDDIGVDSNSVLDENLDSSSLPYG